MTMKMKAQKDDALNVATLHLLAMKIETLATVRYFQRRKNLDELLNILRQASAQIERITIIAEAECDPSECEPWVCCRGICEFDCTNADSSREAPASRASNRRSRK